MTMRHAEEGLEAALHARSNLLREKLQDAIDEVSALGSCHQKRVVEFGEWLCAAVLKYDGDCSQVRSEPEAL